MHLPRALTVAYPAFVVRILTVVGAGSLIAAATGAGGWGTGVRAGLAFVGVLALGVVGLQVYLFAVDRADT